MKTRKKVLWCILALILIAGIVCAGLFIYDENKIKQNSVYCGDKLRQELGDYIENVSMSNATKLDGAYIYTGSVTSEGVNYNFSCKVYSKDNVDVKIEVDEVPDDFDGCNNYFDGCNRCSMLDDGEIVCTELACEEYKEAYCADEPVADEINVPAFEELNQAITLCHVDDMGGYDINVTKMAYILPYKDGYIGFDFDAQDGWNLYLTYRTLENPCDVLSTTDTIFWWNPAYKIGDATFRGTSYPDNKIFYDQGLKSGIPTQIVAKELNCEPGKYGDGTFDTTCTQEAMKYFYDLLIGAENDEYFTQWLKKFKEDIDNGNFRLGSYWRERHDSCLERVKAEIGDVKAGDSEEVRGNYIKLKTEKLHECAKEYLNQ